MPVTMNPSDTRPSLGKAVSLPLGGNLRVATFKCNGTLTKIAEDNKRRRRITPILRHFKATGVQIFALQEPHLPVPLDPSAGSQGP